MSTGSFVVGPHARKSPVRRRFSTQSLSGPNKPAHERHCSLVALPCVLCEVLRYRCSSTQQNTNSPQLPSDTGFLSGERVLFIERYRRGTYNTKHAEAARLYYTTIYIHTHTPTELKLGHAHERRCDPNRLEQHVVARHEAQQHDGVVGGTTDRNSLSARQANGAAMLVEVDAAAVAVLLLVRLIAEVREVV